MSYLNKEAYEAKARYASNEFHYNADIAREKGASEEVIKSVNAIGMEQIFMSEAEGVERSNFLRIYNQLKDRSVKEKMIPQNLQIGAIRNEFLLEGDQERKVLKLERAREIQKQDNIKIKENKNKKTDFKGLLDGVKSMKQIISSMGNTAKK
jgi:hypothetical protein